MAREFPLEDSAFAMRVMGELLKSLGVPQAVRGSLPRLVELNERHDIEQPPTSEAEAPEFWEYVGLGVELAEAVMKALSHRRIRPELLGLDSEGVTKLIQLTGSAVQDRDAAAVQGVLESAETAFRKRACPPEFGEIGRIVRVIRGIRRKTRRQLLRGTRVPGLVFFGPILGTLLRVGLFAYRRVFRRMELWKGGTATPP